MSAQNAVRPGLSRPVRGTPRPPAVLVLLGLLVAATSVLPLGFVVVSSAELGTTEAWDLLTRPRFDDLLWKTTRLLAGGVLLSVLVGVGGAWLVIRTDLPLAGLWHAVLCAPAPGGAGIRERLWLDLHYPCRPVLLGRGAGCEPVLRPSRLPAHGSRPEPAGSPTEDVAASLGAGVWASFFHVEHRVGDPGAQLA